MKWLDEVKVLTDKYEDKGVEKGAIGTIIMSEIRYNQYEVVFSDKDGRDYAMIEIFVGDLEVVRSSNMTDEDILEDLPGHNPNWWCKVEDGYILNLKGERKNKIPYDYNTWLKGERFLAFYVIQTQNYTDRPFIRKKFK